MLLVVFENYINGNLLLFNATVHKGGDFLQVSQDDRSSNSLLLIGLGKSVRGFTFQIEIIKSKTGRVLI